MIKGASYQYVNTLRRYMLDEVPTMAIEEVEFRKNSSLLYDEMIAHRLGLVVLKTDLKGYTLPEKCSCDGEGCAKCTVTFTLKVKGPETVYASALKSNDPKIQPVYPETPIVKLIKQGSEAQELEFEAKAVLGKGKEHAKWSPGHFYYSYAPKITVSNKPERLEKVRHLFPSEIFDKNGKIDKKAIEEKNLYEAVDGVDEELVKVEYDDTSFIFHMESWGALDVKTIAVTALDIFDEQLEEFEKLIKK